MAETGGNRLDSQFRTPDTSFYGVDARIAARVVAAAADIALVIDEDGVIRDLAFGAGEARRMDLDRWLGQPWVQTVADDSVAKVKALLAESVGGEATRSREVNHKTEGGPDFPIRYSAVSLGESGRVVAIGRDLRVIAHLQQQLVGAQQSMEREYARLRHLETRYRLLFRIASEPVLIVDAATERVTEGNPAASELLGETPQRLVGRGIATLFEPRTLETVRSLLAEVRVAGTGHDVPVLLAGGREVTVAASLFRQESSALFLVRFGLNDGAKSEPTTDSQLIEVLDGLPDAFVLVDEDRRVLTANAAFLDVAQLATVAQAKRASLEEWLGRPGVDLNILMANLREHGSVRNFGTIVRGQYGSTEEVEVSGVAAHGPSGPCFGFMIRPVTTRFSMGPTLSGELPSSVQQITGMVGRVPLKEIIRKTTDVIESLCIEAALEVSGDNRASAAQMLGLSRQSLYAKLRRHGLGDLDGGGDA